MAEFEKKHAVYSDMIFEEAVSHLVHSRVFEILGYLSMIKEYKEFLPDNEQTYFNRVEELSKNLIHELHEVIDFYKSGKK